ncbi:MAG: spinster family MFS transporter [Hyphomonadaceae bacterium]
MAETTADGAPAGEARSYGAPSYRGYVLFTLTLVYTLNFIDRNLLSVIAQPVIDAFQLSDSQYGFLNGPPFAIFYALMGIPIAMAADRFNRVHIIALCIAVWSVMAALCGLATSFLFLLFARIGVAIGEAGCTPPANSLIGDYFKPRSRAHALAIYAMGVTIGGALANAFGGPIATQLTGEAVEQFLLSINLAGVFGPIDWANVEGWRLAFIVIGAPGVLVALLVLFTVKEPPRGYSDPPGVQRVEKASISETLKELATKPTFWAMAMGAALTALVGYGLAGFQAPMMQRIHGINPGEFALQYGVPLALAAAAGTFIGGFATERLTPRFPRAVTWIPAVGLLASIPLYEIAFFMPDEQLSLALPVWCIASALHYAYLGSQYSIGQGVVSQRSRASAIAVLLLTVALIGNGLGPQIVGWLSDYFMSTQISALGMDGVLTNDVCRAREAVAALPEAQQRACATAYGEGLRLSMAATTLFFIPAALFFLWSARTYLRDLVAKH